MATPFASGKYAIAECDRCGQRYKLKQLKMEVIKTKLYQLKVCEACWDPDQPQLQLGMYPVYDPQALYQPRPDTTYVTAGLNASGNLTGGSRDIQWGWAPVGGASSFDEYLTPNYLVGTTEVGTVTITVSQELNMAYTRSADGVAKKGKTDVHIFPNSGHSVKETKGGTGKGKGKTNSDMKTMGRNLAKIAAQKRG